MAGNRLTLQQLQALFQEQMQAQQGEIQNLAANVNVIAQGMQATQAALNQLLAQNGNQEAEAVEEPAVEVQAADPPVVPDAPPAHVNAQGSPYTLEKFIKNGAKVFRGATDPAKAEAWTLNMLKSFRAMEVPEIHWVRLATCMFEEEAAFWWEAALRTDFIGRDLNTVTWEEFMEVFNLMYYPENVREQKSREFSNLKQGDSSVRDYERKFIQLERFAPGVCPNERARASKFVWGLRFALKDRVVNQRPQTLAQAVQISCLSEEVLNEQFGPLQKKDKTKTGSSNQVPNQSTKGNRSANQQYD